MAQPTTSKYFLFPIGCLNLGKSLSAVDEQDRSIVLNRAIHWHLHDAMSSIDPDDEQVISAADNEAEKQNYSTQNDEWSDDEIRLLYASRISRVQHGQKNIDQVLIGIQKSVTEIRVGMSRVAFPADLFWEAIKEWNFRDFAVLCSVWSAIGQTSYRRVTFDKIIRGSLGYGTEAEFKKLPKKVEPLSRQQVRATVERLEKRGFFVRCPFNRRHTAYSKRLTLEGLIQAVADRQAEKTSPSMVERLKEVERRRKQK